jgi:hypothetical protein
MAARQACAWGRVADTPATTAAANAATSKGVDCYRDASKRDDREQEYRSAQLELSHGDLPLGLAVSDHVKTWS